MPSGRMAQAARRLADGTTGRMASLPTSRQVLATIASVTAGGAADGNALVTVLWRGQAVTAAGYAASYTPVVGHRVVCDFVDSQLLIAYRVVGSP